MGEVTMDFFAENSIYVPLIVAFVTMIGVVSWLFGLDKRIGRLEKEIKQ